MAKRISMTDGTLAKVEQGLAASTARNGHHGSRPSRAPSLDRANAESATQSTGSRRQAAGWLLENGPRELESLFRAIIYHPSVPILITDDERNYRDASAGAGKLLGLPRDKIIGQKVDDFADPSFRPHISELWRAFLAQLNDRQKIRWDECFADGSFAPAKKGAPKSAKPNAARAQSGWWWSMARVLRWEHTWRRPRHRK